jgi:hypothetical protein
MPVGYDNQLLKHQIMLDLPFEEETGLVTYSNSKNHIVATLNGVPTWQQFINGLQYLDFDKNNPDFLDAPQADTTDLDFTSEDFAMMLWARVDDLSIDRYLMVRGLANTDGWLFFVQSTGRIGFATCQAAATQATYSAAGDIVTATWFLIGMSRHGADVRLYKNGQDVTDAPDTHIDPLTAARDLNIGILDDKTNNSWDGGIHRPMAWNRYLLPWEHREAYLMSKEMFP